MCCPCRGHCDGSDDSDRSSNVTKAGGLSPAEQCLLEGLADQLDASEAELEHLSQLLQQQQAHVAAAEAAAANLMSKIRGVSSKVLVNLLQQALDLLVEQGSSWQAAALKVGGRDHSFMTVVCSLLVISSA